MAHQENHGQSPVLIHNNNTSKIHINGKSIMQQKSHLLCFSLLSPTRKRSSEKTGKAERAATHLSEQKTLSCLGTPILAQTMHCMLDPPLAYLDQ